jgi:hypothetical protein
MLALAGEGGGDCGGSGVGGGGGGGDEQNLWSEFKLSKGFFNLYTAFWLVFVSKHD